MDTNKDYILNLRISKETYEKIKNKAKRNGGTISHLVRNIINDSAEVFSDLSHDLTGKDKGEEKFKSIVTYHKAMLAQDRDCDKCSAHMNKGQVVTVGETEKGDSYYFCSKCK